VRRVLFIIREEYSNIIQAQEADNEVSEVRERHASQVAAMQPSLVHRLSLSPTEEFVDYTRNLKGLLPNIMTQVNELKDELETSHDTIMDQAANHISDQSLILTFGSSRSVEKFFIAAAKGQTKGQGRKFQVIVAESAPYYGGQEMAARLAEKGIDVTVIADAAAFALMPRVDKVFLPTHAVMANGGLIAPSGGHMLALAAQEHSVPVVCITGLFKLCPLYPHNLDAFNELRSPDAVLDFKAHQAVPNAEVLNPAYDYIPPEMLDLYITNNTTTTTGGHQPSYIYRLLAEYYHPADHTLVEEF